jgi:hypothetical protein
MRALKGKLTARRLSVIFGHDLFSEEAKTRRLAHMMDRL